MGSESEMLLGLLFKMQAACIVCNAGVNTPEGRGEIVMQERG